MVETAIIILHYNSLKNTLECINSIRKKTADTNHKIIVIASNSTSTAAHEIIKDFPDIDVLFRDENLGFAKGMNLGIQRGVEYGCENYVLLNNDVIAGDLFIDKIIKFTKKSPGIGIFSPKIYFYPHEEYHKERYRDKDLGKVIWYAGGLIDWKNIYINHRGIDEVDNRQYEKIEKTDFATGCAMIIKRNVIEKIGYLDEKYFLYYEDVDYSIRAKSVGYNVVYFPHAEIWHKNASSSGKPGSITQRYYQTRNRLYFASKYATFRTKKSLFIESVKQVMQGSVEREAVLNFYMGRMYGRRK